MLQSCLKNSLFKVWKHDCETCQMLRFIVLRPQASQMIQEKTGTVLENRCSTLKFCCRSSSGSFSRDVALRFFLKILCSYFFFLVILRRKCSKQILFAQTADKYYIAHFFYSKIFCLQYIGYYTRLIYSWDTTCIYLMGGRA